MYRHWIILVLAALIVGPAATGAAELETSSITSQMAAQLQTTSSGALDRPFEGVARQRGFEDWGHRQEDPNRKSASKALLYSVLLPGLGEYYVGNRKKARYFFAAEAVWWLGFLSYQTYGKWKEDDYINFARERADARLEDKNDDFRDWVGFYDDIDQFNELGRVQDRDRPYLVDNESNHWRWRDPADKDAYRSLKNRSREAFRRRDFTIGLMILSRIVSAIDAVHDARQTRKLFGNADSEQPQRFGYRLDIDALNSEQPIQLSLYARF